MPNEEAAARILRQIELERNAFDMAYFHSRDGWRELPSNDIIIGFGDTEKRAECGTTLCIAGWAALDAGWKINYHREDGWVRKITINPNGMAEEIPWEAEGRKQLGLSEHFAEFLFLTLANGGDDAALAVLCQLAEGRDEDEIEEFTEHASRDCDCNCMYDDEDE